MLGIQSRGKQPNVGSLLLQHLSKEKARSQRSIVVPQLNYVRSLQMTYHAVACIEGT